MIVSGTGHRPQFCPCGFDDNHEWVKKLKLNLSKTLKEINPSEVIAGGAIGFDTWLAEVAIELKIPLSLYLPFPSQGDNWPKSSKDKYLAIKKEANKITFAGSEYNKTCFTKRDRDMVDDCDILFSLLSPEANSGGTYYTVSYAEKKNKTVINFWS